MPGGDRTGPQGQGPLTGRGQGQCGTVNQQASLNRPNLNWSKRFLSNVSSTFRIGRGYGMGRGRGMGRWGGLGRNR